MRTAPRGRRAAPEAPAAAAAAAGHRGEPAARESPPSAGELRELEEQTAVGEIFMGALTRRHLSLSLRVAATLVVMLGLQPLVAWAWPAYGQLEVLGLPLPWLVLGVASYPLMIAMGLYYVREAETIDDQFSELLERPGGRDVAPAREPARPAPSPRPWRAAAGPAPAAGAPILGEGGSSAPR